MQIDMTDPMAPPEEVKAVLRAARPYVKDADYALALEFADNREYEDAIDLVAACLRAAEPQPPREFLDEVHALLTKLQPMS